jgi:Dockerin type I domain
MRIRGAGGRHHPLWDLSSRNGITSSSAAANPAKYALGYAEASDALGLSGADTADFQGQAADATSALVRLTVYGDANLDGVVNFIDLVKLAQNYNGPGEKSWGQGDFNFDGTVDFVDLVKLAQN